MTVKHVSHRVEVEPLRNEAQDNQSNEVANGSKSKMLISIWALRPRKILPICIVPSLPREASEIEERNCGSATLEFCFMSRNHNLPRHLIVF